MRNSAAFPEPNHTQTPNTFFAMLPEMSDAEMRVTLVMIRQTFGFHRNGFKMGVDELATAAGLSRQGALDGATAAEERGTFRRSNPGKNTKAEWELITENKDALQPVEDALQPVEDCPGIKESIKEKNIGANAPAALDWRILNPEPLTQEEFTKYTNDFSKQAHNVADLIDMQCPGGGALAYAFMVGRGIIFPESKIKGQRKAARELLSQGVRAEHIGLAVDQLLSKNMTVTDLYSVTKTAVSIANPPPEQGHNPQGLAVGV